MTTTRRLLRIACALPLAATVAVAGGLAARATPAPDGSEAFFGSGTFLDNPAGTTDARSLRMPTATDGYGTPAPSQERLDVPRQAPHTPPGTTAPRRAEGARVSVPQAADTSTSQAWPRVTGAPGGEGGPDGPTGDADAGGESETGAPDMAVTTDPPPPPSPAPEPPAPTAPPTDPAMPTITGQAERTAPPTARDTTGAPPRPGPDGDRSTSSSTEPSPQADDPDAAPATFSTAPADEAPADEAPAGGAPADGAPAGGAPAGGAPGDEAPADGAPSSGPPATTTPAAPVHRPTGGPDDASSDPSAPGSRDAATDGPRLPTTSPTTTPGSPASDRATSSRSTPDSVPATDRATTSSSAPPGAPATDSPTGPAEETVLPPPPPTEAEAQTGAEAGTPPSRPTFPSDSVTGWTSPETTAPTATATRRPDSGSTARETAPAATDDGSGAGTAAGRTGGPEGRAPAAPITVVIPPDVDGAVTVIVETGPTRPPVADATVAPTETTATTATTETTETTGPTAPGRPTDGPGAASPGTALPTTPRPGAPTADAPQEDHAARGTPSGTAGTDGTAPATTSTSQRSTIGRSSTSTASGTATADERRSVSTSPTATPTTGSATGSTTGSTTSTTSGRTSGPGAGAPTADPTGRPRPGESSAADRPRGTPTRSPSRPPATSPTLPDRPDAPRSQPPHQDDAPRTSAPRIGGTTRPPTAPTPSSTDPAAGPTTPGRTSASEPPNRTSAPATSSSSPGATTGDSPASRSGAPSTAGQGGGRVLAAPVARRPAPSPPADAAPRGESASLALGAPRWATGRAASAAGWTGPNATRGKVPSVVSLDLADRDPALVGPADPLWSAIPSGAAQVVVSAPLTAGGTSLDRLAAGEQIQRWETLGRTVSRLGERPSVLRLTPPKDADADRSRAAVEKVAATVKKADPALLVEWVAPLGTAPAALTAPPAGVDLVGVAVPTDVSWPLAVNGAGGLTAWSDWAARQGKRLAVSWRIDASTDAWTVRSVRAWLDVSARAGRIGVETVEIAPDAAPDAVAAYRAAW